MKGLFTALKVAGSSNAVWIRHLLTGALILSICFLAGGWYRGRPVFDHPMRRAIAQRDCQSNDLTTEVGKGNAEGVRCILNHTGNRTDQFFIAKDKERTPLISVASRRGDIQIVRLLLGAGAKPDATCSEGRTALMWAAWSGHLDVVRELIGAASQQDDRRVSEYVNSVDSHGTSALMMASIAGSESTQQGRSFVTSLLLEKGAKADLIDSRGFTAVMHATAGRRVETIRQLLAAGGIGDPGSIPPAANRTAVSPFSLAIATRCNQCLQLLLAAVSAQQKTERFKDALIDASVMAIESGFPEAIQLMASHALLFPDRVGSSGRGAIHAAVRHDRADTLDLLLRLGGDIDLRTPESRQTPLMLAINAGAGPAVIQRLLQAAANVNAIDQSGDTSLLMAVRRNDVESSRLLLEARANCEINDQFGQPPLILASRKGNVEMANLLIDSGADINQKDMNGQTALVAALRSGRNAMAAHLVGRRADLESRDKQGLTPLMIAASEGNEEMVALLLERGAKSGSRDRFGLDAAARAERSGKTKVARMLK